jgi:hypothetical protein
MVLDSGSAPKRAHPGMTKKALDYFASLAMTERRAALLFQLA